MQIKLFEEELDTGVKPGDLPETLQEVADLIGFENTLALVERFGGEYIFICTPRRMSRPARNRAIYNDFDGSNYRALARKYGIAVRQVRDIVKEERGKVRLKK